MKPDLHPTYYPQAKVQCACGNSFITGSTVPEIHVEICSHCHPFYTGKQKLVDTARRVEKFTERSAKAEAAAKAQGSRKTKKIKRTAQKLAKKPKMEKEEE
ncbi:50S ribosomal protein L31 [Candidatus Uhrbacteria bacterium]|nr:50S ribosomal protein L31 [Candidatus Uhrbacteria bacterium]